MSEVPMPRLLEPMLARSANQLLAGAGWGFGYKWDGYRAVLYVRPPSVAVAQPATQRLHHQGPEPAHLASQFRIGPRALAARAHADPTRSSLA